MGKFLFGVSMSGYEKKWQFNQICGLEGMITVKKINKKHTIQDHSFSHMHPNMLMKLTNTTQVVFFFLYFFLVGFFYLKFFSLFSCYPLLLALHT